MRAGLRRYVEVAHPKNVGLISTAHGVNEFFSIALPPIIPLLVADLGISYAQAGLLLTVFFAMYSVFQLPAGVAADRYGKRRMLVVGLAGMSLSLLLAAGAESYATLVLAQALAGISGSTFHPTGMSLISDLESGETEGRAMGVFGFGGMVGIAMSPVAIGGVAALAGWRAALVVAAALGAAVTVVFALSFRDPEDGPGSGRTTAPRTDGGRPASGRPGRLRSLLGTIRETINVPVTRGLLVLFLITFCISVQTRAIQTFTTSYVADGVGGSLALGNVGFFAMLVAGSLSSLYAGGLADRVDRRRLGGAVSIGTALLVGGTFLVVNALGAVGETVVLGVVTVWFFVIGFVMYACVPVKNALVSSHAEERFSGGLFGVIQTASAVGSATGPAMFGALATQFGLLVAYPAIALVALVLAAAFLSLP